MGEQWRVLVIDDDFRVAGMHADLVESVSGFTVAGIVRSVAEARRSIAEAAPDLLLADVYLPDGDGIDLVRATGVDAIVLSAADEAATVRRALRSGVLGYLVKPFPGHALTERLDRYARFRHVLSAGQSLTQDQVDRALAVMHAPGQSAGASRSATEQLLLDALGDGELAAADAAERAGVSRATAQRRLAAMASEGAVHVRLRYGRSGRPEHLYSRRRGGLSLD